MDVPLGRTLVQVAHKRRDLIPRLSLSYQYRDERVPQGVVAVQSVEIRALHELLKEPVCLVASSLLKRPPALALPTLVAT